MTLTGLKVSPLGRRAATVYCTSSRARGTSAFGRVTLDSANKDSKVNSGDAAKVMTGSPRKLSN